MKACLKCGEYGTNLVVGSNGICMPCTDAEELAKSHDAYVNQSVLREAHTIINGERQDSYGNPEDSFSLIANYWSLYLQKEYNSDHHHLRAKDVAHMMILFKVARCSGQKPSRDNYTDICGYAAIVADRLMSKE